mmetsp:Transcript_11906/g.16926  ORF Transcript_11906/g.16926 Transcript_11906/m.16926 type:complete len:149 (-) Transcript_11906:106-552(-)
MLNRLVLLCFYAASIQAFATLSSHHTIVASNTNESVLQMNNNNMDSNKGNDSADSSDIRLLKPIDPNTNDGSIPSIKLGETIRFEELGPVILNTDGSMRRIDNWDNLTEREREVTWRRISKRNEERRKILLEQQQEQQQQQQYLKPQE